MTTETKMINIELPNPLPDPDDFHVDWLEQYAVLDNLQPLLKEEMEKRGLELKEPKNTIYAIAVLICRANKKYAIDDLLTLILEHKTLFIDKQIEKI